MMPTPSPRSARDDANRRRHLAVAERGGRLVHDDDAGVGADAPWRSRPSAARASSAADQPIRIDRGADPFEQLAARARRAPPVDAAPRRRRVPATGQCSRPPSGRERAPAAGRWPRCRARASCADRCASAGTPSITSVPASACSAPVMILMSVDLPAPFSPTSACTSPRRKSKDTRSSARSPAKALLI